MKTKTTIIMGSILLFILFAAFTLRPVPTPPEKECLIVTGVVEQITEAGVKDIVFKLKDNNNLYYINRGLENGFTLEGLRKDLTGKEVTIKYPDYWSLLANKSVRHISKLEHDGKIVYTEVY
jgi:hypothetical protein